VNQSQSEVGEESERGPNSDGGGRRVSLDQLHTLVLCADEELSSVAERVRSAGGDGDRLAGSGPFILLFRSAHPAADLSPEAFPKVWIEAGELRFPLRLSELAGWEQPNSAAVALLHCDPPFRLADPLAGPAQVHLSHAGTESAAELPAGWLQHIHPLGASLAI
jgi:hypothetical protein